MKQFGIFLMLITSVLFLSGIKKNNFTDKLKAASAGVSIANTGVLEGNGGQRAVEVMVILSPVATNPVTISYATRNGSASAGSDYMAANGTVSFAKGESMKKIMVSVIGDLAVEASETFEIVLSNASGAALADSIGTMTIVNDDFTGTSNIAAYEVRFTFNGYTSFYGGPPDCPVRTNGKVVLEGLLSGIENVNSDDDILYTGELQLYIDVDIGNAMRISNGEDRLCVMTVTGSGPVNTELELYYNGPGDDSARGGYIKINHDSKLGSFIKKVTGDCKPSMIDEEETMVPNKTIASIFNGYELSMLINRTLRVGRYVITGEAGETVVEVLRKLR